MKRFEKIYEQGVLEGISIWVDRETGVQYVAYKAGYAGGLTPLLDSQGKPVINKNESHY